MSSRFHASLTRAFRAAIVLCVFGLTGVASAEVIAEWQWDSGAAPSKFFYRRLWMNLSYPKERTPDDEAIVAVRYGIRMRSNDARLIFGKNIRMEAREKYKISFWIRSSEPVKVWIFAISLDKPYSVVSDNILKKTITQAWEKIDWEFVPKQDFDGSIALPLIHPFDVIDGLEIFLGPVRLERLDTNDEPSAAADY